MKCPLELVFCSLIIALSAGRAIADPVTIGVRNGGNCLPFGCAALWGDDVYQQAYSATAFPEAMWITSISFFDTERDTPTQGFIEPNAISPAHYRISLSTYTTSHPVPAGDWYFELSTNPWDNVGPDSQLFFDGFLGGPIDDTQFALFGSPFYYNPDNGNLLLHIEIGGSVPVQTCTYFDAGDHWQTARITYRTAGGIGERSLGYGLVTRFGSESWPVPEPSTLALLSLGIGIVCCKLKLIHRGNHPPE